MYIWLMSNRCILLLFLPFMSLSQETFTSSNLPIVVINTNGQVIQDDPRIVCDMGIIYNKLTDSEKSKIKFVIDTCHSFTAGYDLSNKKLLKSFIELLEKNLGTSNISCIHLNDSYESLGSRKDRHQNLLLGHLSGKDTTYKNFCAFLKYGFDKDIPFILETDPCLHIAEIQLLKNMI